MTTVPNLTMTDTEVATTKRRLATLQRNLMRQYDAMNAECKPLREALQLELQAVEARHMETMRPVLDAIEECRSMLGQEEPR